MSELVPMTHAELVKHAARWLSAKCPIVVTELANGSGEEPDALGFNGCRSTLCECKASKSDYYRDRRKSFRRIADIRGVGLYRYYVTPEGLLNPDRLPPKWGLIEIRNGKPRKIKESGAHRRNAAREVSILVSAMRRTDGVSVKHYTIQTKCRATIGIEPDGGP